MPEAQTRAAAATKRIEALEKELKQLQEQRHRDTDTLPRTIIGYGQRRNELKTLNPHLFASLDNAARMRLAAKNKTRRMPADPLGWSAT